MSLEQSTRDRHLRPADMDDRSGLGLQLGIALPKIL